MHLNLEPISNSRSGGVPLRLLDRAVGGTPAVRGEGGVDLIAQPRAVVRSRGHEVHDLEQIGCEVQNLGRTMRSSPLDCLASGEQAVYEALQVAELLG